MSCKWPRSEPVQRAPNGASNASPFSRSNLQSTISIPTGTVASRVQSLQNLQSLSGSNSTQFLPTNLSELLGGRLHDRYAAPGPGKVSLVDGYDFEIAPSILDLANPLKGQKTANSNQIPERRTSKPQNEDRTQRSRPHGRADKMLPHGERPVHASVSKLRALEVPKRVEDREHVEPSQKQPNKCDRTESDLRCMPIAASKPQSSRPKPPLRPETARSETSFTTTSTMRRLSVRELFHDYGVERPAGFASPKSSFIEMEEKSCTIKAHVCCHVCSFTNKYVQLDCQKCGHHFCSSCPAYSTKIHYAPPHGYMKAQYKETYVEQSDMRTNLEHSFQGQTQQKLTRPDLSPIQGSKNKAGQLRGTSSQPVRNPSLKSEVSARRFESTTTQRHISSNPRKQSVPCQRSTEFTTSTASEKPIVHSMQRFLDPQKSFRSRRRPGGAWDSLRAIQSSPNTYAEEVYIDEFGYQEIHNWDTLVASAYCKQNSDGDKREVTGNEAGSGQVDNDPPISQTNHPYFSKPHSLTSQPSNRSGLARSHTPTPLPRTQRQEPDSSDCQVANSVECHGYPRTGHGQCGSPVEAGIVGECQHCVDDCECLACQSTPHNVRCCTHQDHPSIAHTHQTSQTLSRLSQSMRKCSAEPEEIISATPLSVLRQKAGVQQHSGTTSRTTRSVQRETMKKKRSPFKYPVVPIDTIESHSSGSTTSAARRKNTISTPEGILSQNRNYRREARKDTSLLPFEQPKTPENQLKVSGQAAHTLGHCPVPSIDSPWNKTSGIATFLRKISRESLTPQARKKEGRRERIGQAKKSPKGADYDLNGTKGELKSLKQLEARKKEEGKLYEEDKSSDQSTLMALFLNYQFGRKPRRANRPSSPPSPKHNREVTGTPSNKSLRSQYKGEAALRTSALGKDLEVDARGRRHIENDRQRGHFKSTTKGTEVMGITVIVHMSNKEDLFFHVDTSMTANR